MPSSLPLPTLPRRWQASLRELCTPAGLKEKMQSEIKKQLGFALPLEPKVGPTRLRLNDLTNE
eukprot:2488737-Pyramimonas_sp.AAC.1